MERAEQAGRVADAPEPTPASIPSGEEPLDASANSNDSPEGGITAAMSETNTISQETHAALLEKAVRDATSAAEATLAAKADEVAALTAKIDALTTATTDAAEQIKRLTDELDAAQVALKAASDEVTTLKADAAAKQQAAEKAELAIKRADQVRALGLFPADYITEKASRWADFAEADWNDRIDEWRNLKPGAAPVSDAASAMTGTSGGLADKPDPANKTVSARRAVLGLTR